MVQIGPVLIVVWFYSAFFYSGLKCGMPLPKTGTINSKINSYIAFKEDFLILQRAHFTRQDIKQHLEVIKYM